MSECVEKRFENMIYAYELGMLSEKERQEFELHLYECDHCFEKVRSFQKTADELRNSPLIKAEVSRMDEEYAEKEEVKSKRNIFRTWQKLVPAAFATAAIILLLLLKPFSIEIRSTEEAVASQQRLVILQFENMADKSDSEMLGRIAANLLRTYLAESYTINVVSSDFIEDIILGLDIEDRNASQRVNAVKIAKRAGAGLILTGKILQTEPSIVLSYELYDIMGGTVLASERISGSTDEDIFDLVDRLGVAVRNEILTPAEIADETNTKITDLTTSSADAYRHYLEGIDYYQKVYWDQADQSFRRALEYDSTFAMAWYYLSIVSDHDLIEMAVKYSDNISFKERSYILARKASHEGNNDSYAGYLRRLLERYPDEKEALYGLGTYNYSMHEYDSAIAYLKRTVEIDPFYRKGYNMLAYSYSQAGDLDKAIRTLDRYIEIAPGEANPHDSKGAILASHGNLKAAIESYRQAVQIKSDFFNSHIKLGFLLIYEGQYDEAESHLQKPVTAPNAQTRASGRLYKAYIPVYSGKLEKALKYINDAIIANELEEEKIRYPSFYHLRSMVYREMGMLDSSIAEMEKALDLYYRTARDNRLYSDHIMIQLLAENNRISEAKEKAAVLEKTLMEKGLPMAQYWYARGAIELAQNRPDSALTFFKMVTEQSETSGYYTEFISHFMLGRAYLESGYYAEAISEFKELCTIYSYDRLYWGPKAATVWYYRARAYDLGGETENAMESYRKFNEIWKDADSDLSKLQTAKERLRILKSQS